MIVFTSKKHLLCEIKVLNVLLNKINFIRHVHTDVFYGLKEWCSYTAVFSFNYLFFVQSCKKNK